MENPDALKHLFGKKLLKKMADVLQSVHPAFDRKSFLSLIGALEKLEMKPRVRFLREELRRQLPKSYPQALRILLKALHGGQLEGFELWPFSDFVQTYGLDHVESSLDALRELTPLFSSEFAVRPFLIQHPVRTLKYLHQCAQDSDEHLRRWASEGSRPRLPWGERLLAFVRDPSPTLKILERLKYDDTLYVRKSVSNHLNDIAKDHPERVIKLLSKWKSASPPAHLSKIDWIVQRSLRTLIKAGHPGALKLIGVSIDAGISLSGLELNQTQYRIGDRIEFGFTLFSRSSLAEKLVVDYIVHFVKANGETSPKVFKLKILQLPAKAKATVSRSHHLKHVTTRSHYPGQHWLEIQVNGQVLGRVKWVLLE